MQIEAELLDGITVLQLKGRLVAGDGDEQLRTTVRRLLASGREKIVLDVAGLSYVDSTGLGEIVRCYTSVTRMNGELKLRNLPERIRELLAISKLLCLFADDDDEPSGLAKPPPASAGTNVG